MPPVYFGFSSTQHDSSIAIVNEEGRVVFAEANERSLKNKRAWNTVPDSIGPLEPLLKKYAENKQVVASLSWSNRGLKWSPLIFLMSRWQQKIPDRFWRANAKLGAQLSNRSLRQAMYKAPSSHRDMLLNLDYRLFESAGTLSSIKRGWDHHLCHAATACYSSHLDSATCVVVDGLGEGTCLSIYAYEKGEIKNLQTRPFVNTASLGLLFSQICWACGFDPIAGEEWKVMGLASYGKRDPALYELLRPMLRIKNGQLIKAKDYAQRLTRLVLLRKSIHKPMDSADLAFTGQLVFEEVLGELLREVHRQFGGENLILTGGCALNSSCNGKMIEQTPYRSLHVPMAPGDDGNSIGAALLSWKQDHPGRKPEICHSPFLGSELSESSIKRVSQLGRFHATIYNERELIETIAHELAEGKLLGWVQGRAEFGPRALGNRSILADPRQASVKEKINSLIKFREEFRPFAPSVLHELGPSYFQEYQYAPYMDRTLKFSNPAAAPGVVHIDGTGRLQSVTKELNPLYYALIKRFYELTGVPMLLNTSFNVMGRPIIHDVEDALGVFLTSGIDILVLSDHVFRKSH